MPPRKPMAAMANMAPEAMPSRAGRQLKASSALLRGQDMISTPAVAMHDGQRQARRQPITQEGEAENGNLNRLGLGVGGGDHEGTLAHGGEQQGGGTDLRQRCSRAPGQHASR